ncbi:MAG: hypothetical protein ACI4QS_10880 [Comamonas sp.]
MANQWFRLYSEFAHDPKVQMMSEAMQRRYIMLMCMRCNGDVTLHDDEVAFHLRISAEDWAQTKALFISKGFIDDNLNLLNWEKRQFKNDSTTSSAERVRRFREKKKQVSNADETLHETLPVTLDNAADTDTDTEQNRNKRERKTDRSASAQLEDLFNRFWVAYPRKIGKDAARSAFAKRKPDEAMLGQMLSAIDAQKQTEQWQRDGGQYIPHPSTWLNQGRFNDEVGALFAGQGNDAGSVGRFV